MSAQRRRRRIGGWLVLCAAVAAVLGVAAYDRPEPVSPAEMLVSGAEVTGTQIIVKVIGPALY